MTPEERHAYDEHLNAIMIQNDVLDGAKLEGLMEGRMEGRVEGRMEGLAEGRVDGEIRKQNEIAANMKKLGLDIQLILEATGLTLEEIEKL